MLTYIQAAKHFIQHPTMRRSHLEEWALG